VEAAEREERSVNRDNEAYAPEDYPPETVAIALVSGATTVVLRRLVAGGEFPLYDWAHSRDARGLTCSWDIDVTPIQTLVSPQHNTIPEEKQ
jgi:hypothetical protein